MEFYEKVNEEMAHKGISIYKLSLMCAATQGNVRDVCKGEVEPTKGLAERICRALGIEWDLTEFVTFRRAKRVISPKARGKIDADERAARELGISYGVYCAYKDTGYLKTFIADEEARRQAEAMRKVNVVESNVTGGYANKRNTRSLEARKL